MKGIVNGSDTMFDYKAKDDLLKGRVILITGAGSGIGRAAAISFAAHGATVILSGRTVENLEQVYDEIVAAGYTEPAICPFNLNETAYEPYEQVAEMIEEEFGRLDGVLHNAGQLGQITPLETARVDTWYQLMQVNVNAAFMLTKALLPLLKQAPDASIVFTSSSVGRRGRAHWGAYAVSKFAVEGLMQVLADELENISHIRVNSINPGATNTTMRKLAYPGEVPTTNPDPSAIMPAYLFLMGPDSKGTNGEALDAQ
jgi:NAD(P)-dependent dehydrogenase (short-subunit alcohol dehydrogenase family)